jgi:sigma-E factor negative regulatory protein RseA
LSKNDERLREMVSAVVDGEASDFECRSVLHNMGDPEVRKLLARHYAVRAVARAEVRALCPPTLSASILAAVATEPPAAAAAAIPRWRMPLGGVAVAASVCMAAVFGLRALSPVPEGAAPAPAVAAVGGGETLGSLGRSAARAAQPPGYAVTVGFDPAARAARGAVPDAHGANRLAEERLQLFMHDHVQNASLNTNQGMLPYARVAAYETR